MKLSIYDRRAGENDPEYLLTMARAYVMLHAVREALDHARPLKGHKRDKAIRKMWKLAKIAARGHALTIIDSPRYMGSFIDRHAVISAAHVIEIGKDQEPLPHREGDVPF